MFSKITFYQECLYCPITTLHAVGCLSYTFHSLTQTSKKLIFEVRVNQTSFIVLKVRLIRSSIVTKCKCFFDWSQISFVMMHRGEIFDRCIIILVRFLIELSRIQLSASVYRKQLLGPFHPEMFLNAFNRLFQSITCIKLCFNVPCDYFYLN